MHGSGMMVENQSISETLQHNLVLLKNTFAVFGRIFR